MVKDTIGVVSDPIADMLTRIRNANAARHTDVRVPSSRLKLEMAQVLKDDAATPECIIRALMRANRAMYDTANRQKIIDLGVTQTKAAVDVVTETFDLLVKAKAWPQNEGLLKANIEGTIKSEKDFGKITKDLKFEDVTDLTIAKKVVEQLGRVANFPY